MKNQIITSQPDNKDLITKLMNSHFPKAELVFCDHTNFLDSIVNEGPFDLVLLDINDINIDPSSIINQINELYGAIPTIFLGNQISVKNKVTDYLLNNHPSNAIINLPDDFSNFIEVAKSISSLAEKKELENSVVETSKDKMLPMKIKNFYRIKHLHYDAFVEILSNKFVKVLQHDTNIVTSQIDKLVKSGNKVLYFQKEDKIKFLEKLLDNQIVNLQKKTKSTKLFSEQINALNILHEYIKTIGVTKKVNEVTKLLIASCDEYRLSYNNLVEIILMFPFKEFDICERSIFLTYLNLILLEHLSWNSDLTKEKMCMSSFYHDITLIDDSLLKFRNLDDLGFNDLSEELKDNFIKHPSEAAKIVSCFTGFHASTYIIEQHHELPTGKGFPLKLNGLNITTLSCLFIIADTFTHLLCNNVINYKNIDLAYKKMEDNYQVGNFKEATATLKHCLSFKK